MNSQLNNLLLHPTTKMQIDYVFKNPPHAIMLSGPPGSGKTILAKAIAANLLGARPDKDIESHPYFIFVKRPNNKQDIAIEQIREVTNKLRLKVPGQQTVQRVVFIDEAHLMSLPAQNALLKSLEEPPAGVVLLLGVTSTQSVLPTIASRVQKLDVQPVVLADCLSFWKGQYPPVVIESAWRLSGGTVGLLQALLAQDAKHPLKESVDLARKFLKAKTYERLIIADKLSKDKEQFGFFLDALARILNFLHRGAIIAGRSKQADNLLTSRRQLQKSQKAFTQNANAKLLSLNLVLNLKI